METTVKVSDQPDARESDLEGRVGRLEERERLLRSLLLDSRDALVRRLSESGPSSEGRSRAPGETARPGTLEDSEYLRLRDSVLSYLKEVLPTGALALVVGRGDDRLLEVGSDRRAWHFPTTGDGGYAGHHPADSAAAIAALEELRRRDAGFLVFPATSLWWLEHYADLARHLDRRYQRMEDESGSCVVYDLRARLEAGTPVSEADRAAAEAAGGGRPLAAVTIISRNYLAQARVLAETFHEQEPDGRFYALVVDGLPAGEEVGSGAIPIDLEELDLPELYELCFKYGVVEFNTAVKPYVLSLLMDKYGEREVAYFDPDIMIMRRLEELRDALDQGDIVLTPHIMSPLPLDGKRPTEQDIMISGAYNLGFIAVKRSEETRSFLTWWQERLRDGCRIDVANGLFTDQKWIDLVPSLFPSTVIFRDPTYNVAFWNLHERAVTRRGEEFLVEGRPAGFFHISGFHPDEPRKLSKHQNRLEIEPGSALESVLDRYRALLHAHSFNEASDWEYGFERFDSGIRVHPVLRRIYLNQSPEDRQRFGNPFSTEGPDSFLCWATRPAAEGEDLSPFLQTLYDTRYDLAAIFPDVRGRSRRAFVKWARRWGSAEMGFEPELVQDWEEQAEPGTAPASSPSGTGDAPPDVIEPSSLGSSYETLVERIRNVACTILPAGSNVLVISKGDPRLLDLGGSEGWHFPQTQEGIYGGYHPPNSEVAIAHLEALREKGADYLLIPKSALWWLEYYGGLRRHVEAHYRPVAPNDDSCLIYSLRSSPNGNRQRGSALRRWWLTMKGGSVEATSRLDLERSR